MSNDVLAVSFSSRALLNIALENNGAAQQAVAARRLDSFILKQRASSQLGCCSLGAVEQRRSASLPIIRVGKSKMRTSSHDFSPEAPKLAYDLYKHLITHVTQREAAG